MIAAALKEHHPGERRVALTPDAVRRFADAGLDVLVEAGAGEAAGFPDEAYREQGASIGRSRSEAFGAADLVLRVRCLGADPQRQRSDLELMRPEQVIIGQADPMGEPNAVREAAEKGVAVLALELVPRISRAQSMDVLSSQSTVAGYQAVLMAARRLPRFFPMMMTAAGTVSPARVFVVGAGVAGLQAIATARRLGARVSAYDVRPEVREEVESLGARFVELDLEPGEQKGRGGYAGAREEEFYRRQQELMAHAVGESDVVITTAAVPGRQAPLLVSSRMVAGMAAGSVIVDVAAERGGNVETSRPGEEVTERGVTILAPLNLPSAMPGDASRMYARNCGAFVEHLLREGRIDLDRDDEITRDTLITRGGQVIRADIRDLLKLAPLDAAPAPAREGARVN